jgi:hypothetical protein
LHGPQYHTRRKHGHIRHQQHSPTPGHHLYKKTQTNTSKSLFSFLGQKQSNRRSTPKKLRLKSERASEDCSKLRENKTKQNKRETPAMQQHLSYLQTKQTALSSSMFTRENGCEKATRRDSKKRCSDHSLGTQFLFIKRKAKQGDDRVRAYEKIEERQCVKLTTGRKKNWTMVALGQRFFFFFFFGPVTG